MTKTKQQPQLPTQIRINLKPNQDN